MSCCCKCPVALPHGAAGRSAVSDCGIWLDDTHLFIFSATCPMEIWLMLGSISVSPILCLGIIVVFNIVLLYQQPFHKIFFFLSFHIFYFYFCLTICKIVALKKLLMGESLYSLKIQVFVLYLITKET